MPASLSKEWIDEQLAICQSEADTRHLLGAPKYAHKYSVQRAFLSAAREGYPLVLRQHICLTHALDTCVQALTKILEKHGRDWVQRDVIFGAEEFKQGMQAVKDACDALGYVLKIEQISEEAADASE